MLKTLKTRNKNDFFPQRSVKNVDKQGQHNSVDKINKQASHQRHNKKSSRRRTVNIADCLHICNRIRRCAHTESTSCRGHYCRFIIRAHHAEHNKICHQRHQNRLRKQHKKILSKCWEMYRFPCSCPWR